MIGARIVDIIYDRLNRIQEIDLDNNRTLWPSYDYATDERWIEVEETIKLKKGE